MLQSAWKTLKPRLDFIVREYRGNIDHLMNEYKLYVFTSYHKKRFIYIFPSHSYTNFKNYS